MRGIESDTWLVKRLQCSKIAAHSDFDLVGKHLAIPQQICHLQKEYIMSNQIILHNLNQQLKFLRNKQLLLEKVERLS